MRDIGAELNGMLVRIVVIHWMRYGKLSQQHWIQYQMHQLTAIISIVIRIILMVWHMERLHLQNVHLNNISRLFRTSSRFV